MSRLLQKASFTSRHTSRPHTSLHTCGETAGKNYKTSFKMQFCSIKMKQRCWVLVQPSVCVIQVTGCDGSRTWCCCWTACRLYMNRSWYCGRRARTTVSPLRTSRRPLDRGALSGHKTHIKQHSSQPNNTVACFRLVQEWENHLNPLLGNSNIDHIDSFAIISTLFGHIKLSEVTFVWKYDTRLTWMTTNNNSKTESWLSSGAKCACSCLKWWIK